MGSAGCGLRGGGEGLWVFEGCGIGCMDWGFRDFFGLRKGWFYGFGFGL